MPNIPRALELVKSDSPELYFDPYKSTTYFTSTIEPVIVRIAKWLCGANEFSYYSATTPTLSQTTSNYPPNTLSESNMDRRTIAAFARKASVTRSAVDNSVDTPSSAFGHQPGLWPSAIKHLKALVGPDAKLFPCQLDDTS